MSRKFKLIHLVFGNKLQYACSLLFLVSVPIWSCCQSDHPGTQQEDTIPEGFYRNPVFEPVFADPSVIKAADGYFYAYATEDNWGGTDGYHLVPVIRSKNLVDWELVADAFRQKPGWKSQGFIWAPDINFINGQYYLYYSYSLWGDPDPGIGLAISDFPSGPFTDIGKLFLSSEIGVPNSIDPFYIEDDGKKYIVWGSFHGLYGIELSPDGKAIQGEKFKIAGNLLEGAYILKRNGYFYLFGSSGSCCDGSASTYRLHVGRASGLKGPYTSRDGESLLTSAGTVVLQANSSGGFAGPGHNAEVVTDNEGQDWLLYHAVDRRLPFLPGGATRRPLMLDRLHWHDGWPFVKENQPGTGVQERPSF